MRPLDFKKACEQLKEKGLVYGDGEAKDSITWQQARTMTKKMVESSLNHPNACCADYAQRIGIEAEMNKQPETMRNGLLQQKFACSRKKA